MSPLRHLFRCSLVAACVLCSSLLPGCSSGNSTGRLALAGSVTFDGQPVDGGSIAFLPEGEAQPTKPGAQIEEGKYHILAERGAFAGLYRVEIHWPRKTGRKVPFEDTGIMKDETVDVIPAKFNVQSELKADIKPGATTFDFDLKSN